MGVSYSIMPIAEVHKETGFIEHIDSIDKYGTLDYHVPDYESRYPTLDEVYDSLKKADIVIKSEIKKLDQFELKNGKRLVIHSMSIIDKERGYEDDLTVKYFELSNEINYVNSISGIKSDIRILIKFVTRLTKICGSYLILSPYEVCFIDKSLLYEEIINEIKGKLF